jgi:hypothetical protein
VVVQGDDCRFLGNRWDKNIHLRTLA